MFYRMRGAGGVALAAQLGVHVDSVDFESFDFDPSYQEVQDARAEAVIVGEMTDRLQGIDPDTGQPRPGVQPTDRLSARTDALAIRNRVTKITYDIPQLDQAAASIAEVFMRTVGAGGGAN